MYEFLFILCIIILITIIVINAYTKFESHDIYFGIPKMDMVGNDIRYKTNLSMTYTTDCEDWCNNEPSCKAYVVEIAPNVSLCHLKNTNTGPLRSDATKTVNLRQTPNLDPLLGVSFSSVFVDTDCPTNDIAQINWVSPIDCMSHCVATPTCTGFIMTTDLHPSPYTCYLKSGSLENTVPSPNLYMMPMNGITFVDGFQVADAIKKSS